MDLPSSHLLFILYVPFPTAFHSGWLSCWYFSIQWPPGHYTWRRRHRSVELGWLRSVFVSLLFPLYRTSLPRSSPLLAPIPESSYSAERCPQKNMFFVCLELLPICKRWRFKMQFIIINRFCLCWHRHAMQTRLIIKAVLSRRNVSIIRPTKCCFHSGRGDRVLNRHLHLSCHFLKWRVHSKLRLFRATFNSWLA